MDARLKKLVDEVLEYASNPPEEIDAGVQLQVALVDSGLKDEFDEAEVIEAAIAVGVPKDKVIDWLQDFASWL